MAMRLVGPRRSGATAAAGFAAVALFLALSTTLGPAASASCAGEPTASPYAFVGTVTGLENAGRVARVTTEDGRSVVIVGSPESGNVFTSVDRTYELGATYEFHPYDDSDPYSDNACSATRELTRPPAPQQRQDIRAAPDPGQGADQAGSGGSGLVVGTATALAAAATGLVVLRVGRRRRPGAEPATQT